MHTEVPFGVIIAYFLYKEIPSIKNIIGIIIAFVGLFVLLGSPNLEGKLIGILLLLFGAFAWSFGMVIARPLSKKIGGFAVTAWVGLFCGPMLLIGSFIFDGNTINYLLSADLNGWLIVGFLGIIMQPLAYGTWYQVMGRNPVHKVMPVMLLLGSFIFDGNTINYFLSADLEGWLIVAFLGIIMQPLAYGTWYQVMGRNPVHKVMPLMLLLHLSLIHI